MIGYLHGNLKLIFNDNCILDVSGVGYRIYIDDRTREALKIGQETEFFIYTAVNEGAIKLYGFKSQNDYELFSQLITVNGVGARTALNVLSKMSSKDLALAIHQKNITVLTSLPGIGKKSAQRLILELKDKISYDSEWAPVDESNNSFEEAAEGLLALGYTNAEISSVFKKAKSSMSTEELIKFALKNLQ